MWFEERETLQILNLYRLFNTCRLTNSVVINFNTWIVQILLRHMQINNQINFLQHWVMVFIWETVCEYWKINFLPEFSFNNIFQLIWIKFSIELICIILKYWGILCLLMHCSIKNKSLKVETLGLKLQVKVSSMGRWEPTYLLWFMSRLENCLH